MDFLQFIGSLGGIAGVLAVLIFVAYRYSCLQIRDDRKYMEDRLNQIIESYNNVTRENTKVLAELNTWLRTKNGGSSNG